MTASSSPHPSPSGTRRLSDSLRELYAHLGADEDTATRIDRLVLGADMLLSLDCGSADGFLYGRAAEDPEFAKSLRGLDPDSAEFFRLMILSYPPFEPSVLTRLSHAPRMEFDACLTRPIARICDLGEGGVNPLFFEQFEFDAVGPTEYLEWHGEMYSERCTAPTVIRAGGAELQIGPDGFEGNDLFNAERAQVEFGGPADPAVAPIIEFLGHWIAAARPEWPTMFPFTASGAIDHLIEPNTVCDADHDHLSTMWYTMMLTREAAVVPRLLPWDEAFQLEHPTIKFESME